jgi:hypothetical protein
VSVSRPKVILLAVRWYLRDGLSYRDLEELLAARGIEVDHVQYTSAQYVNQARDLGVILSVGRKSQSLLTDQPKPPHWPVKRDEQVRPIDWVTPAPRQAAANSSPVYSPPWSVLSRFPLNTDYAEPCVKPRSRGFACVGGVC